ncbi:hypothetical protein ScPMuIL_007679 [Solemya velum]
MRSTVLPDVRVSIELERRMPYQLRIFKKGATQDYSFVNGSCPADILKGVLECLPDLPGTEHSADSNDMELINDLCKNGGFNKSVDCVETLKADCIKLNPTKYNKIVPKVANPLWWKRGFSNLCNNLELYNQSNECITGKSSIIENCTLENESELGKGGVKGSKDVTRAVCRYFIGLARCMSEPIKPCGEDVADMLLKFIEAITPPSCFYVSTGTNVRSAVWVESKNSAFSLLTLTIYFMFLINFVII